MPRSWGTCSGRETPVAFDRVLATRFGYGAVQLLAEGIWNQLVVQQNGQTRTVPIASVAGQQRTVPADDPLVRMAQAVGTSLGGAAIVGGGGSAAGGPPKAKTPEHAYARHSL